MRAARTSRRPDAQRRAGFTLIETALATIIVGVGVLAIVSAHQAFLKQNVWSTNASVGTRLGNEIRELTLNLPRHDPVTGQAVWGPEANETFVGDFDDVDDFDGAGDGLIFSAALGNGPISARREVIPNMDGWSQTVRVFNVDPFDMTTIVADGTSDMLVVEVTIEFQPDASQPAQDMTRVYWLVPN